MKYATLDLGKVEAVFNKLGGIEGADRFLSTCPFEVWKTVRLGTYESPDMIARAIVKAGFKTCEWVDALLQSTPLSPVPFDIDLVLVDARKDLGIRDHTSLRLICKTAMEKGLTICPPEVGPQLRLQYNDQPHDQWLRVAMPPIRNSNWDPGMFRIDHGAVGPDEGGMWLRASNGEPNRTWVTEKMHRLWVFARPRLV